MPFHKSYRYLHQLRTNVSSFTKYDGISNHKKDVIKNDLKSVNSEVIRSKGESAKRVFEHQKSILLQHSGEQTAAVDHVTDSPPKQPLKTIF